LAEPCDVLETLALRVLRQHSYIITDKVFCVYIAEDENVVRVADDRR
jgi:hypothetical protein